MSGNFQKPKASVMFLGIVSILLLLYAISLSGSPFFLRWFGISKINGTLFFITRMLYWLCVLLLWLYAIKVEKQKLLIWEEKKYRLLLYLLIIVLTLIIVFTGSLLIQKLLSLAHLSDKSSKLSEIVGIFRTNKFLLVFTALTAGVTEELILRGYLFTRLEAIFKSPVWAIIISSLLFGLLHYKYGTINNVIVPAFIGVVFSYHYWKYRNIKILIICHFLVDMISLLTLANQK